MKSQFFAAQPVWQRPLTLTQQTEGLSDRYTKVSLHDLVGKLLEGLQPLAMKRGSVVLNGISRDLSVMADENLLAYVLWNLISSAVSSTKNECIHVVALDVNDRTIICVKDVGTYFYQTISREYRKIQDAAEKLGGSISLDNDDINGMNISFSLCNHGLVA